MFLTNLSLKRPVFATVTILALVALGLISYVGLNINDYPEVEFPYVVTTIVQPGASPEQVETNISQKMEEAVGQISGVKHIYSIANESVSTTIAEFSLETEPEVAAQEVRDKVGAIRGNLPQDIEEPVISRFDPMSMPIINIALTGDISPREMTVLVDDVVKQRLEAIDGVGNITVYGSEEREIQIDLDKDKLAAYGLSTTEVLAALSGENMDVPGGKLGSDGREMTLRTSGNVERVEDFAALPVARRGGAQLYVRDIAVVKDGVKERESFARYQGTPAVGLDIIKQSGTNTVEVADNVKAAVTEIRKELPPGVNLVIVGDNSVYIRDAVNDVLKTIFEGSLLAVTMVFLFLKDWRSTLISSLSIPISIIATFFAMKLMGFSINFLSLMALSLAVGLLIDDAIVVIENIVRHMRLGKTPLAAAREATDEIGLAVTATTFTVVAVFLPVAMMTGIVGQFFKQFGLTVVFSVLVSLLVSFTLAPLLASRHLKAEEELPRGPVGRFLAWFNRGFGHVNDWYARFIALVLRNRFKTLALALLLFFGSLAAIPLLGSSFIPTGDTSELSITAELDAGLSLDAAGVMGVKLEEVIRGFPEVAEVYSSTNRERVSFYVKTVAKGERERTLNEIAADMRRQLGGVPGAQTAVNIAGGIGSFGSEKQIQMRLLGDDLEVMQQYSEKYLRVMEGIPGVVDVGSSFKPGKPEGKVFINRDAATDLGISSAQVAETLRTLFNGVVVSRYVDGEDRVDVKVRLAEDQRKNMGDLGNIYLPSRNMADGGGVPMIALSQVTEQVFGTSPSEIRRFDRVKEIVLSANLEGISLGEFNQEFEKRAAQEQQLPAGYSIFAGGESEMMGETFTTMFLALITGVLFIFFILASLFESYIDPFAIMLSIPMAVVGAIFGLLLLGSDLSLMSMIGIIMLMGLVTKNAILLIDFTKQQRAAGVERNEALQKAALTRLRPIVMTTMAMIFGMTPLALALGPGAESRAPMAHAIIGGLITSTLLTLVVVPVIYTILDDIKNKFFPGKRPVNAGDQAG